MRLFHSGLSSRSVRSASVLFWIGTLLLLVFTVPRPTVAQVDEIDDLLRGGVDDARLLIDSYLAPGVTGFESGLNTGWAGSAAPHKRFGFYVHAVVTLTGVPSKDQAFTIDPADLETFVLENGTIGESPTVGGDDDAPTYQFRLPSGEAVTMPEGSGFSYVPVPLVEAGVGLGWGTDFMLRLVPPTDIEDYGDLSLVGVGVKHGLNQWLPGGQGLPVNLAALFQYTKFNLNAVLDEDDNQDMEWDTNTWTLNLLVGKRFSVLNVYGGLGVETSSSTISLLGTYQVEDDAGGTTSLEDPLDVDFGHDATLRGLAGLQLRLSVVSIFAEGTLANYSSGTVGLGINIR